MPNNLPKNTFLVVNITLDTKEIKGGREELVLRPPGSYFIETFEHSGEMRINRRYNLSYLLPPPSPLDDHVRGKRFSDNAVPEMLKVKEPSKLSGLPKQTKLFGLPDLGGLTDMVKDVVSNMLPPIPSDLSSLAVAIIIILGCF